MNRALVDRREVTATEEREISTGLYLVAPGVWRMKDVFVNVFIIQNREGTEWALVDAGLKTTAPKVRRMVEELFGSVSSPKCILMTHGHFDHRGSLRELADEWGVPVYCHHMEVPYLTGKAAYPPADPTVGGGMMTMMSPLYPKQPIDISDRLAELPEDGSIPDFPDWRWIHTPGHTPGHISLFRENDGLLIAGDAVVTTRQESLMAVLSQAEMVAGPPKYFTPDWGASARSVRELAALEPNIIATGHGHSMYGDKARKGLHKLAREFWKQGMPLKGRYVKEPALFNEEGPTYIPPMSNNFTLIRMIAAGAFIVAGIYLYTRGKSKGFFGRHQKRIAKKMFSGAPQALSLPNPV